MHFIIIDSRERDQKGQKRIHTQTTNKLNFEPKIYMLEKKILVSYIMLNTSLY